MRRLLQILGLAVLALVSPVGGIRMVGAPVASACPCGCEAGTCPCGHAPEAPGGPALTAGQLPAPGTPCRTPQRTSGPAETGAAEAPAAPATAMRAWRSPAEPEAPRPRPWPAPLTRRAARQGLPPSRLLSSPTPLPPRVNRTDIQATLSIFRV